MRGSIGCDHPDQIAAIGQQRGIEAESFFGDFVVAEWLPIIFFVTAIKERVGELVVVVVMRLPADFDRTAIGGGRRRWRGNSDTGSLAGLGCAANRAGLYFNFVHHRSNVLGKIIYR